VSPLHSRLIDTFHNGGDWNKLKIHCITNGVHDKLAEDLRLLRVTIREALDACRPLEAAAASSAAGGAAADVPAAVPVGTCGLLSAMLMLVSDGQGEEMSQGPYAWQLVGSLLNSSSGSVDRTTIPRPKTASNCSTTASTVAYQESAAVGRDAANACRFTQLAKEVPLDAAGWLKQSPSSPIVLLPRPRRVGQDEGSGTPGGAESSSAGTWNAVQPAAAAAAAVQFPPPSALLRVNSAHQLRTGNVITGGALQRTGSPVNRVGGPPREHLVYKLSDLKDKVDWLAEEMAKLGDKRQDGKLAGHRNARLISEFS